METILGKHWHHLPADEVVRLVDSNADKGLDRFEVEQRVRHFGENRLPERRGPGALRRFAQQFQQPLVYILVAAGGVTLLLREWVDAAVILGVVVINAFIGFLQEAKAVQAIAALARTMRTNAKVLRAGERLEVSSESLVPGDIVLLQSGDKVPADLRLINTRELLVDESSLTGESLPVIKTAETLAAEAILPERQNMAYSSSLVTYGQGTGVVVATGAKTEVGQISALISSTEDLQTPLTKRIAEFSHVLLWIILGLAVVTFAVGVARGETAADMFMAAVALAVGAIPEGLPAAVTIVLAIGVARMAARRAVVRKLPAVETLGSTTVVCSDKTGTLTENEMTVCEIWAGGERFQVTGVGYRPRGEFRRHGDLIEPRGALALVACLKAGVLCNESQLLHHDGQFSIQGDPTEGALLVAAEKAGVKASELRSSEPRRDEIPFESQHQFMATLHGERAVYLKGAVEKVLERCEWMMSANGQRRPIEKEPIVAEFEAMGSRGLRVLAIAGGELPHESARLTAADVESGLTFFGLQGMIDPPRPEAIAAVYTCRTAGVSVKMITGDHAVTARAIAEQIGILPETRPGQAPPHIYTGQQLAAISDAELIQVADQSTVFARVTPEQKLRLVRALQSRGHIVAMTGDGVNDGPALKQANIGIAMGLGGTEVAKESGDVVLTDDNFASIEAAIEEGRGVFDNLTKFIVWTLPTNLGEGMVIFAATMLGATLPILPLQILWINLTTSVFLGLTLAFEPKERDIMLRAPRDSSQPILTRELLGRVFLVGTLLLVAAFGLFEWALWNGASVAVARTIAVSVFVFGETFYLLNCRSLREPLMSVGLFTNRWLWLGIGGMTSLQLLFVYHPTMNRWFDSAPLDFRDWTAVAAASLAIYIAVAWEKRFRRRSGNATPAPHRNIEYDTSVALARR